MTDEHQAALQGKWSCNIQSSLAVTAVLSQCGGVSIQLVHYIGGHGYARQQRQQHVTDLELGHGLNWVDRSAPAVPDFHSSVIAPCHKHLIRGSMSDLAAAVVQNHMGSCLGPLQGEAQAA